jgi:hypothetical protein
VGLSQGGSDFTLFSTPAAATQATATKAAGTNGTRHVIDNITAVLATGATAQAAAVSVVVRDGATGAGAILFAVQLILPVNGFAPFSFPVRIVGSPNTAITVEFSAAGVAGSFESISATGHDEN